MNYTFNCPNCTVCAESQNQPTVYKDKERIEKNSLSSKLYVSNMDDYKKHKDEYDRKVKQVENEVGQFNKTLWNRIIGRERKACTSFGVLDVHEAGFLKMESSIFSCNAPIKPHCKESKFKYIECTVCGNKHFIGDGKPDRDSCATTVRSFLMIK